MGILLLVNFSSVVFASSPLQEKFSAPARPTCQTVQRSNRREKYVSQIQRVRISLSLIPLFSFLDSGGGPGGSQNFAQLRSSLLTHSAVVQPRASRTASNASQTCVLPYSAFQTL